jgi:hypothetical protein
LFEKKIRPLLVAHCYGCHSAKATKTRGGLCFDSKEGMLAGGDSGPAIVAGDAERSRLIRAVRYTDPDLRMPPKGRLTREEVADLETWVKRGAPMPAAKTLAPGAQPHWAFAPVRKPLLPQVRGADWAKNPIDRFILAGLEAKGLQPSPPADKRTLCRRITLDLTGLPPTPQQLDAFLADGSSDAVAHLVDRLLASAAYGERWGRHWLDLVRYTDDFEEAWRYRDWVIDAFNRDLPYDQFIIRQIAGDRLPAVEPGQVNAEGIVATTMLAIGQWGGIDRKKRLADIVDDQIDTIGRSFLGLTLACARCHDHKFDPIPTADYYGLAGIFYSSRVISDSLYLSHSTKRLRIPLVSSEAVEKHWQHIARLQHLEHQLGHTVDQCYAAFARGLLPQTADYLLAAWDYAHQPADQAPLSVEDFASKRHLQAFALSQWQTYLSHSPLGDFRRLHMPIRDYDGEPGVQVWGAHAERPWWGVNPTAREVPIETWLLPAGSVSVNPGVEGGAVAWKSPFTGRVRLRGRLVDADPHDGAGVSWAIDQASAGRRWELSSGNLPNGGSLRLDVGRTPERLASIDVEKGDELFLQVWLQNGDAHYDITNVELTITRLDGRGQWDLGKDARSHFLEGNPHRDSFGNGAVWHYYDMADSNRKQRMPAVDPLLARWRQLAAADKPDRKELEKAGRDFQAAITCDGPNAPAGMDMVGIRSPFWVHARDDAKYLPADARTVLQKKATELEALKRNAPPLPCANGAQEGGSRFSLFPGIQDVRIHGRGSYANLGDRIPRHFPRVLAGDRQPRITSGSGRMELARWIAAADNPLTARVFVNRIWQHHFGEGIVRTPSNFGRQGSPPTHPELLDWLARQFIAGGWSVKAMQRLILGSAAYQQSSSPEAALAAADVDNLLLGRMNRRRLEAEALRDCLLAVSGRLDDRRGGPAENAADSLRRMVYLKSSRSDRSGFGPLFDAANASIHVEKRTASTLAPQALCLMNGALVLDAAQHLVRRPQAARGKYPTRIHQLYRVIFSRPATAGELLMGCRFIEALESEPAKPAESAGNPALLDAWETYAQALLLSNEFLFVD